MENDIIVASLDIGTTKIACIVGQRTQHGKVKILGVGKTESLGVSRGVVTNIAQTIESIQRAIAVASDKAKVDIFEVNVGIAGQHIKSYQHRGVKYRDNRNDEITQTEIDSLIDDMFKLNMPPGEQIIHVLPQQYIIDSDQDTVRPIGMAGSKLEANFHVVTGQETAAYNIKRCVERSGLDVTEIILEPLASAEAVLDEQEKEAGVCLIDIGGGTTDIAIFQDGIIRHTAVIPFGGNVITEDIRNGCSIIKTQAELLKVRFGTAFAHESQANEIVSIPGLKDRAPKEISVQNLSHIIQCRMEEIIEHIKYEIRNSGYERKLTAGIVVTGGGAQLKHLPQLLEYAMGLDVRIGYPNEYLAEGFVEEVTSPLYATAVGLLIKGLERVERNQALQSKVTKTQPPQQPEINHTVEHPLGEVLPEADTKITGHSQPNKKGSFFENLFKKTDKWLKED